MLVVSCYYLQLISKTPLHKLYKYYLEKKSDQLQVNISYFCDVTI